MIRFPQTTGNSLMILGTGSTGDFHHPDIYCISSMARHAQPRRFLQCIEDNFIMQAVEEPMRRGGLLDF